MVSTMSQCLQLNVWKFKKFESISSDFARNKINELLEAAENKIVLGGKDASRTPRLELIKFYLKYFVQLTLVDDLNLDDTLRVNNWKFCRGCNVSSGSII